MKTISELEVESRYGDTMMTELEASVRTSVLYDLFTDWAGALAAKGRDTRELVPEAFARETGILMYNPLKGSRAASYRALWMEGVETELFAAWSEKEAAKGRPEGELVFGNFVDEAGYLTRLQ